MSQWFLEKGMHLFCRLVDFYQWLNYLLHGNAPGWNIYGSRIDELAPHRKVGFMIANFMGRHGIDGTLFLIIWAFVRSADLWRKEGNPVIQIKKAKGVFKFQLFMWWYGVIPVSLIGFILVLYNQIKFFINGRF